MVAPFSKAQLFEKRLAQSNISQQVSLHALFSIQVNSVKLLRNKKNIFYKGSYCLKTLN